MQVSMTVRAVLGIWLASPKNSSPSLNPCYRGSLLLHPNLPDLSLSLVGLLASTLCQRMPDLVLLPQAGPSEGEKARSINAPHTVGLVMVLGIARAAVPGVGRLPTP